MLSKFSVKKPYTVIVGIILALVLGYISFQHMTTDLLPSMNLPYVVVYTPYVGATPEQVETDVTRPMEAAFATLTNVKKITSSSRDNVSVVIMQFNDGANMDTALIEISSRLDQLRGGWDDDIGAPVTMKLNPDMLPVAILSVSRDDMDILALSDYVEDELVPAFESLDGVTAANASGVITQQVDITIEQSRIDALNSAILRDIDAELADVEQQLNEAQAKLSDGKRQLARAKKSALEQIDGALEAIEQGADQIDPAIEQLNGQRAQLVAQRDQLAESLAALEQLIDMGEADKAQLQQLAEQLAALKQQAEALAAQIEQLEQAPTDPLAEQLADAQAQRAELAAERQAQQDYLDDLKLLDAETLRTEIAALESEIAGRDEALAAAQAALPGLESARDATQRQVESLQARIAEAEKVTPSPEPEATPTSESETPGPEATPTSESETPGPEATPTSESETPGPEATPTFESETPGPEATPTSESETPGPEATPTSESETPGPEATPTPETETPGPEATPTSESETPGPEATPTGSAGDGSDDPDGDKDGGAPSSGGDTADQPEGGEPGGGEPSSGGDAADQPEGDGEPGGGEPSSDGDRARLRLPGAMAEESLEALRAQLSEAQALLAEQTAAVEAKSAEIDALTEQQSTDRETLAAKREALAAAEIENEDIAARMAAARQQIALLDERIGALDEEIEALTQQLALQSPEALAQQLAVLNEQIAAIEGSEAYQAYLMLQDPESLQAQYAQAQAGLAQLNAGIEQIDQTLDKLSQGIIPGGFIEGIDEDTKLSEAESQLKTARKEALAGFADAADALADGEAELAKARREFIDKRDEALENAGLDGVITVQMVSGIIGAQNFAMPAGYVHNADDDRVLVRVGDKFDSLDSMRRMKLFSLGLDSIDEVRLLDVASVAVTDDRDDVFTKLNGTDGILLSFDKQSTYSTADVADTILARAEALMAETPGLHIVDLMNQGEYIDIIVDSVLNNLLSGGALAILILLLFLMDFRPTITVAFSIPISVVVAFVCMYFSGITLNVLSLSGLSLGIGMLVDNSIVAIENIYRLHDEENMPLLRACVEGVRSVAGALFASTLTTICVFLPIVFVQGMARDLFADMGLTIAYSLLASLLVAMTVVPALTSFLMRRSKPKKHRVFSVVQRLYTALLRGALRVKPLVLLAALGLLVWSGMQVPKMGISFMPEVNSRQMSANLTFAPGMTDRQQKDQALALLDEMMAVEGIESVGLMGGDGGVLSGLSGGSGMSFYIMVDEAAGRKNTAIAADLDAIAERLGADLKTQASTMDISMMAGSGISVEITGDDIEVLQAIARDVADLARQTEGTVDVDDGLEDAVPEMRIEVDKEKAVNEGLTTAQVYQFIAQKLAGRIKITEVSLDGQTFAVNLIEGRNSGLRPEDIEDLEIEVDGEDKNKLVRIGDIAGVRDTASLSTISRSGQKRMVTVSFDVADGYSANLVSDDFEQKLNAYALPAGYSAALAGENETVIGIMQDLVWMVLIAILLIFLIMVAQFQSFKSPIIVMFTIPLAFTGGLLALLATGMDLSIVSMLGFLVLSGVVVNNGIVFIDCVNQLRIGGMEKKEALIETGRIRLRPILMTALTTILGMSTMALGRGTGAEMMQPMAVVSIGGLSYATLMTLFIVPVLYDLLNGKKMRAREIQMIKEAAGLTGDEVLDADDRADIEAAAAVPAPVGGEMPAAEPTSAPAPEAAPAEPAAATAPEAAPAEPAPETVPASPEAPPTAPAPEPAPAGKPIRVTFASRRK